MIQKLQKHVPAAEADAAGPKTSFPNYIQLSTRWTTWETALQQQGRELPVWRMWRRCLRLRRCALCFGPIALQCPLISHVPIA